MSYEYATNTPIAESQAKSVVREIIEKSIALELVGESDSTIGVIYPVGANRESGWDEDVQFVFHSDAFRVVIHNATGGEREELIRMIEEAFQIRGVDLQLEEE